MTYRAGLIGCGGVSKSHSKGLQAAHGVELVALADVYEPNLRTAGEAYGVERLYTDYQQMIEREQLDVLAICTQAPQHAPVTIAAAEMGVKGILCEKPIALTLAEADAMIETCARTGTRLAINHQTRMVPNTFLVERLLKEGAIGDLRAIRMIDKGGRPVGAGHDHGDVRIAPVRWGAGGAAARGTGSPARALAARDGRAAAGEARGGREAAARGRVRCRARHGTEPRGTTQRTGWALSGATRAKSES